MSYADQSMSGNRITALIIVALIHVVLVYALITGLAYEAIQKARQVVSTVDIKEDVKKEEPPPPKKVDLPPPPTAPVVKINVAPSPPEITTVVTPPPAPPPIVLAPPPAAPPPPSRAKAASPNKQASWAARIQENYPPRALREEREGRVGVRVTIGADGRVSGCSVSSSSGSPDLDQAACDGMTRYARYNPALDDAGNPTSGSASTAIVYRLN